MDDLAISLKELEDGLLIPLEFTDEELEFTDEELKLKLRLLEHERKLLDEELEFTDEAIVSAPCPPPTTEWSVSATPRYQKIYNKIKDKKIKAKILDAISYLFDSPMTPKGDIVKPLIYNHKGLWRHEIGEHHRLAYFPDKVERVVTLVYFNSRENFYNELADLSG